MESTQPNQEEQKELVQAEQVSAISIDDKQDKPKQESVKGNLISTKEQLLADTKEEGIVQKVYEWAVQLMMKEKERLKELGVEPIDLPVIDMSLLVEGKKKQINRVIFNSEVDFKKVTNILISQSIPCEIRPGYQFVNVVLYATSISQIPLIFPYVYKTRIRHQYGKNNLKHWILINKKFDEAYHLVNNYETIK
eukprot:403370030